MLVFQRENAFLLWQDTIRLAEKECACQLAADTESYLIQLLTNYLFQTDWIFHAKGFQLLSAIQQTNHHQFKMVGDECLLLVGLFPHFISHSFLKPRYYVRLGQTAYLALSKKTDDLYALLSFQFVKLMDILQSVRLTSDAVMTPLEAHEQWEDLRSQRALRWLNWYAGKMNQITQ